MNIPHLFGKLDREVQVRVVHLSAMLSADVTDSEASAGRKHLCCRYKCLPYARKYNAQNQVPGCNIDSLVIVKLLKEAVRTGPCMSTGILSSMQKRMA